MRTPRMSVVLAAALSLLAVRSSAAPLAARPMSAQGFARVQGVLSSPLGSRILSSPDMRGLAALPGIDSPSPELLAAMSAMDNSVMAKTLDGIRSGALDGDAAVRKFEEAYRYSAERAREYQEDVIEAALDSNDLDELEAAANKLESYAIWGGMVEVRRRAFLSAVRAAKSLGQFRRAEFVYGEELVAAYERGAPRRGLARAGAKPRQSPSASAVKLNAAVQDVANAPLEYKAKIKRYFSGAPAAIPDGYVTAGLAVLGLGVAGAFVTGFAWSLPAGAAVVVSSLAAGLGTLILGVRLPAAAPRPSFRSQLAHFMDSSANPEISSRHARAAWSALLVGSLPVLALSLLGVAGAGVMPMMIALALALARASGFLVGGKTVTRGTLIDSFGGAAVGLFAGAAMGASLWLTLPMAAGWALGLLTAIAGAPSAPRRFPRFNVPAGLKGTIAAALFGSILYAIVPFGVFGFAFFGAWAGLAFLTNMR